MAPQPGFDTEQVKDKARKDLLYLLEGVSHDPLSSSHKVTSLELGVGRAASSLSGLLMLQMPVAELTVDFSTCYIGSRKEKPRH